MVHLLMQRTSGWGILVFFLSYSPFFRSLERTHLPLPNSLSIYIYPTHLFYFVCGKKESYLGSQPTSHFSLLTESLAHLYWDFWDNEGYSVWVNVRWFWADHLGFVTSSQRSDVTWPSINDRSSSSSTAPPGFQVPPLPSQYSYLATKFLKKKKKIFIFQCPEKPTSRNCKSRRNP